MKYTSITIAFLFSVFALSQEQELALLKADTTWGKEIITFPVSWAPQLTVTGFEELRFAPGWGDQKSEGFWSLVMAWQISNDHFPIVEDIETNLEAYYDGLMKPNHWATEFPAPNVVLVRTSAEGQPTTFKGKIKVFDGFHTGTVITLNVEGDAYYCEARKQLILLLRISPAPYQSPIWKQLNAIMLLPDLCY